MLHKEISDTKWTVMQRGHDSIHRAYFTLVHYRTLFYK